MGYNMEHSEIDEWKELIMNLMKKLRLGKTIAVLVSMSLLAGCGSKNKVTDDTEKKADKVETTEETTEAAPATGTDVTEADVSEVKVEYGSTIRASTKLKVEGATTSEEDRGETTFVVSKESEEFQYSDYEMSDEEIMANVDKAIGKKIGDTFTLSFEFGDGSYNFTYTILEIIPPEESDSGKEDNKSADWKKAYKRFLTGVSCDFEYTKDIVVEDFPIIYDAPAAADTYSLAYVDDDDIPELIVNYTTEAYTWYGYMYYFDGDSVKRVEMGDNTAFTEGFRSLFSFKERTGLFVWTDGTGVGHYWDYSCICDYNSKKVLHSVNVFYQSEINYTIDDKEMSEDEAKEILLQYYDSYDLQVDVGIEAEGFTVPEAKKITRENIAADFGEEEPDFESEEHDLTSEGIKVTVPEGFYDYTSASSEYGKICSCWNPENNMKIFVFYDDQTSSSSLSGDAEYYKKKPNYTFDYEYIDEDAMVESGYKPDGKTVYYYKEAFSNEKVIKIYFEYPDENKDECNSILEAFLNNMSY